MIWLPTILHKHISESQKFFPEDVCEIFFFNLTSKSILDLFSEFDFSAADVPSPNLIPGTPAPHAHEHIPSPIVTVKNDADSGKIDARLHDFGNPSF